MDSENEEFMVDENTSSSNTGQNESMSLQNLNSLPFKRREMDQWNTEFNKAVEYKPKHIPLFNQPPPLEIKDSTDAESIKKIREYFMEKISRKRQLVETVDKNTETSGNHIKKQLCNIDLASLQSQMLKKEIADLKAEFSDLNFKTQLLQKENNALKTRLAKYQASDDIDRQRSEDARSRAKLKEVAIEKQRQVIRQVEAVLDSTPGAVATLRKRFDRKEGAGTSKSAIRKPIPRPRMNPSVTTESTSSSGGSSTNIAQSRFHRRSQSVGAPLHRR